MNKNDIIIFGKWFGDGYGEYFAIVRRIRCNRISLRYGFNGEAKYERKVKHVDDVNEGDNYWREAVPIDFTDQSPVSGQVVWVSCARDGRNSRIYQGIVLSSPEAFSTPEKSLRTAFGRKTRTLLPQSQATVCDSFWSVEQPDPVYCSE